MVIEAINEILKRKKLPILVGGSGLYAESVINGYVFGEEKSNKAEPRYECLKIAIALDRDVLKARIAERTQKWLREGLLKEVQGLLDAGISPLWLDSCGQEYRHMSRYLQAQCSLDEAILKANTEQLQFVKRQYTWWRRHADLHWVLSSEEALVLIKDFLT